MLLHNAKTPFCLNTTHIGVFYVIVFGNYVTFD